MNIINLLLMVVVLISAGALILFLLRKKRNDVVEETVEKDDKTFTLEMMTEFVKRRLDEITKINLYDIRTFWGRIEKKEK